MFFLDRISEGIKIGIQKAKEADAWVYYEPNSCRQYSTFYKNVAQVDIVKFSEDRIPASYADKLLFDLDEKTQTKLIIISQGENGLKFSLKSHAGRFNEWISLKAEPIKDPVDTSGAGDWLAATFLWNFLKEFAHTQVNLPLEIIKQLLKNAQMIAARSCMHIGAQGIFKSIDDIDFLSEYFNCEVSLLEESEMGKPDN